MKRVRNRTGREPTEEESRRVAELGVASFLVMEEYGEDSPQYKRALAEMVRASEGLDISEEVDEAD